MGNKLYVGNLAYTVRDESLHAAFSAYGTMAGYQPGVYETAAAYDSVNDRYLVVYTRYTVATGSFDIYGQLVDTAGAFIGSEFGIAVNTWDNRHPAVAFDPVNAHYLVVYEDAGDGYGIAGSLLDVDLGTYPYVTSSNATSCGIPAGAGVPARTVGHTVGVIKAYATRVGAGPFPSEQDNDIGHYIRERGHEYGSRPVNG